MSILNQLQEDLKVILLTETQCKIRYIYVRFNCKGKKHGWKKKCHKRRVGVRDLMANVTFFGSPSLNTLILFHLTLKLYQLNLSKRIKFWVFPLQLQTKVVANEGSLDVNNVHWQLRKPPLRTFATAAQHTHSDPMAHIFCVITVVMMSNHNEF